MNKSRRIFLLFVVCAISFSGSALAKNAPLSAASNPSILKATITTVSGREITGDFQFAQLASYRYGFRSNPKDKFRELDIDTIVRLVLSNEDGVLGHFESTHRYYSNPRGFGKSYRLLLLVQWVSDGGTMAIAGTYSYDVALKKLTISPPTNFSLVCFKAPNAEDYVDFVYYNPYKSSYDFLIENEKQTAWIEPAYNEYFKKYCPEFLEKRPFATSKVFEPMKFLKEYEGFCVND